MKHKNESISPSCALCAHALFKACDADAQKPPLLFFLTANCMDEEAQIVCPYQKNASPSFHCRRFTFDPLKYRPKVAPKLGTLDEDALLLD